jgi:hypothetical protein
MLGYLFASEDRLPALPYYRVFPLRIRLERMRRVERDRGLQHEVALPHKMPTTSLASQWVD